MIAGAASAGETPRLLARAVVAVAAPARVGVPSLGGPGSADLPRCRTRDLQRPALVRARACTSARSSRAPSPLLRSCAYAHRVRRAEDSAGVRSDQSKRNRSSRRGSIRCPTCRPSERRARSRPCRAGGSGTLRSPPRCACSAWRFSVCPYCYSAFSLPTRTVYVSARDVHPSSKILPCPGI